MVRRKPLVFVGMSGGVDSAVAALLLKEQGDFDIVAVHMQNWQADQEDSYCTSHQDLHDAKIICEHLQIPLQAVNFAHDYWQKVFQIFLDEYAAGRTPNPDILCNKEIKFKAFLDFAKQYGATHIATGHYAQNINQDGCYHLLKANDHSKDQSYFLYTLQQDQLRSSLFPLGTLLKSEVRSIAKRAKLPNYAKKDSTGICFIGERNFKNFLSEYLLLKPGNILTTDNEVIGKHDGLMFYTLGQRQGLKIGGKKGAKEAPWYVIRKDIKNNVLFVAQEENHPWLLAKSLFCNNLTWVSGCKPPKNFTATAKIRYRQSDQACVVQEVDNDLYRVDFSSLQRAITPGQSVVFYQGAECLGGGVINC
jgi:tRNA-uridine 2-sulfurtransferase